MSPEEAVQHAMDGNAILFTGAGFSRGARNLLQENIPAGRKLATDLLAAIGYHNSQGPLDKAAAAYLRRLSARDLIAYLSPRFTVTSVSESHRVIARLPFRRVYTTNYDHVWEFARTVEGLSATSIRGSDEPRLHAFKKNLIVHLNGSIANVDESMIGKSFKLVSESYASDSFESSGWAFQFRSDVRSAKAIIFVGYSMYDLDIRRVIYNEDVQNKCVFFDAPVTEDNVLDAEDLADLGVLAPIGVDGLAKLILDVSETYVPQEGELLLDAWEKLSFASPIAEVPDDQQVLDFLTFGDISPELRDQLAGPDSDKYSILRSSAPQIADQLLNSELPVVVAGDLGTGKTVLAEMVGGQLAQKGFAVYRLVNASNSELRELQAICESDEQKLLVVENYERHKDVVRWLSESFPPNVALLMTARASSHDLAERALLQAFSAGFHLHDLSRFDSDEANSAVQLFDRFGLWQDRASWREERKVDFIRVDCSSALPSLLVDVLKSQHITARYRDLLAVQDNRSDVEALLICIFALEAAGFSASVSNVQELLSGSVNWGVLRTQHELRSVVVFDHQQIRAKSSVLAVHLLREVFSATRVVTVLTGMVKAADQRRESNEYFGILNALMRYGNVSIILADERRLEATVSFYEGIKNLGSTRRNPQFWLQYAIGCLTLNKLERSERYFKTAYSFAGSGYNTYQIDNHFARLLFEKALLEENVEDAKLLLDRGVVIVLQQMAEEVKYYPYRVALGVFRFYDKFKSELTPVHKKSFARTFAEIAKRAKSTPKHLRTNRYVNECQSSADKYLAELDSK